MSRPEIADCLPDDAVMVDRAMFEVAERNHWPRWALMVWSEDNQSPAPDGGAFWVVWGGEKP